MLIVFVIGNYKNGGVAMRSTNLANAFAEKAYKHYFFYWDKYKPFARKLMSNKLLEKIYSFVK